MIPVIEDFFRLLVDALIYYNQQLLTASVFEPILSASISALTLQQEAPLTATLHFLRDFLSYGTEYPNSTFIDEYQDLVMPNPLYIQQAVRHLIVLQGEGLTQRILTGMMFHFPRDCFPDASGVLLSMFELIPQEVGTWLTETLEKLPAGTIKPGEAEKLVNSIGTRIQAGETRRVRVLLQGTVNRNPIIYATDQSTSCFC